MASQQRIETLLNTATNEVIQREKARQDRFNQNFTHKDLLNKWKRAAQLALRWSRAHYKDHITVTEKEHMSEVDCFDGARVRKGRFEREAEKEPLEDEELDGADEDLAVIHPVVDGRLKDEGRK